MTLLIIYTDKGQHSVIDTADDITKIVLEEIGVLYLKDGNIGVSKTKVRFSTKNENE